MMNKKKCLILISICVSIIIAVVAIVISLSGKKSKKISDSNYVTASEWISMLADHTGCDDIVLPNGYEADSLADDKLIAITAMKTISTHKYERIIDDIGSYTDEDYYKLAKDYGLINDDKKHFNQDECKEILARYNEIYTDDLWLDDYCEAEFQDGVKELDATNTATVNDDGSVVSFADNSVVNQGDIIIYTDSMGCKRAGKVDSIDESGACHMSQPEISDVVTELDLSDKTSISYEDIVKSGAIEGELISKTLVPADYATDANFNNSDLDNSKSVINESESFNYDTTSEGFEVKLSVEENDTFEGKYLGIEISDNENGESAKYLSPIQLNDKAAGSLSIAFTDIKIAADTTYFQFDDSKKYAEYRLDMDTEITGDFTLETGEDDFKIPIAHINVPFEMGFVSLDFEIYLQLTAEGHFEIVATLPTSVCVRQEQGSGIKSIKDYDFTGAPSIQPKFEGEAMISINLDAKLYVLWIWDIIGAGVKAGALADLEVAERDNGMICTDFNISFPVVKANIYFNGIIQKFELEFDILAAEDAPFRWNEHYEEVPGIRPYGKVPECSYGNDELFNQYNADAGLTEEGTESQDDNTMAAGDEISIIFGHNLYSRFDVNMIDSQMLSDNGGGADGDVEIWGYTYDITDTGTGYKMVGKLTIPNCIPADKFYGYIDAGKFTHLGRNYTVVSREAVLETRSDITLLGDDGVTYHTGSAAWLESDGYDSCYALVADTNGDDIPDEHNKIVIENATIYIPYGTAFEGDIKFLCEHPLTSDPMVTSFGIRLDEQGNLTDMVDGWSLSNVGGWY